MGGVIELLPVPDQHMTLASSGLITLGPIRLNHIILTAGANDLNVDFYDGRDDSGDLVFSLDALSNYSQPVRLGYTIEFTRGLYLLITGSDGRTFVSWQPCATSET